jgi:hypothetical protein
VVERLTGSKKAVYGFVGLVRRHEFSKKAVLRQSEKADVYSVQVIPTTYRHKRQRRFNTW